jgi:hypothetical protein
MAIRRTSSKVAYSTNKPLQDLAPLAVAARRGPKPTDLADVATIWVDIVNHDVWIASGFQAGQAQWSRVDNDGGPGEFTSLTINPGPTSINGEFTILGGDVHIGEGTFPGTYNFGTGNAAKTVTVGGVGFGSVTTIQSGFNSNLLLRAGGAGAIDYSKDFSGGTVLFVMTNNSNTANSDVKLQLGRAGTSGGNCEITYATLSGNNFVHGLLASDQSWNLEAALDLGTGTPLIKARANGEVSKPLQPAFIAKIDANELNVTGNGTNYQVGSNGEYTEVRDQGNNFDAATGVFTAPVDGVYQFSGAVRIFDGAGATGSRFSFQGAIVLNLTQEVPTFSSGFYGVNGTAIAYLTAGQQMAMYIQIDGLGGDTADVGGDASLFVSWFQGYLVA